MRWIGATVFILMLATSALADVYQVERIRDSSMSCDELVVEVEKVEGEINEAADAKLQAKRDMDAERDRRYGRKKSPLGELLSTTEDVLESVQGATGGDKAVTPRERYDVSRETERNATYRRRYLMRLYAKKPC